MGSLRHRALAIWAVSGVVLATAAGYLLALVHYPVVEAVVLGFLLGLWFAWSSPLLLRGLVRWLR